MQSVTKRSVLALLAVLVAALAGCVWKVLSALRSGEISVPSRRAAVWTVSWRDDALGYSVVLLIWLLGLIGCALLVYRIGAALMRPAEPRNATFLQEYTWNLAASRPHLVQSLIVVVLLLVFALLITFA